MDSTNLAGGPGKHTRKDRTHVARLKHATGKHIHWPLWDSVYYGIKDFGRLNPGEYTDTFELHYGKQLLLPFRTKTKA